MAKTSPLVERAVRIELLRARAALEREQLVQNVADLAVELSPSHMVRSLFPALGGLMGGRGRRAGGRRGSAGGPGGLGGMLGNLNGGNAARLLLQGVTLARRYPFVLSGLSALFLRGSRRSRLLKVAAAGVAGWQGYRMWQRAQEAEHPAEGAAYPVPPIGRGIS